MRAKEFVNENTFAKLDLKDPTLTNARVYPGADQYYDFYRMSLDLAKSHHEVANEKTKDGVVSNNPMAFAYTDEEAKMLDKTAKGRGFKSKTTSAGKSKEMDDTYAVSPVAKFKPKR